MKKLIWAFILDEKGLTDIYSVAGQPIPHPELHTVVGVHETNPDVGSDCKDKLFHSKSDIIYPLELEKMIQCYSSVPSISRNVVNHSIPIVNHTQGIVNG